jgi:uncharacterized protein involved in exopolysaccharide biosynthesis
MGHEPEFSLMSINLRGFLWILRRRIWLVLGFVVVSLAVAAYLLLAQEPTYRARAVVQLGDARRELSGGLVEGPAAGGGGRGVDRLVSEMEVIRSRGTAEAVVDSSPELLVRLPEELEGFIDRLVVQSGARSDSVSLEFRDTLVVAHERMRQTTAPYGNDIELDAIRFRISSRPPVEAATLHVLNREVAIGVLLGGLGAGSRQGTNIIDIYYSSDDPSRAVRTANRIAEVYQSLNVSRAQQEARLRREFLEGQLRLSDSLLGEARRELASFRAQRGLYGGGESGTAALAELGQYAVRRGELQAERQLYQDFLRQLEDADPANHRELLRDIVAIPALTAHPELGQLYGQLVRYEFARDTLAMATSTENPDVRQLGELIEFTEASLVRASERALRSLIPRVSGSIETLERFRAQAEASYRRLSTSEAQEARLVEQVEAADRITGQIRNEYQKAQLAEAVEVGDVEILERAVGASPVGARTGQNVALVLMLGLAFGVITAVVAERLDTSIHGRRELTALGLPVLGVIPRLVDVGDGGTKTRCPVRPAETGSRSLHRTLRWPSPMEGSGHC